MKPRRVQRKRIFGWRMPLNTVYVGRPTYWGNRFVIDKDGDAEECVRKYESSMGMMFKQDVKKELKGKNLACFCPLDKPCHADILLEIANS
jgi:hypothetical protein